ncbi:MAG: bifunctional phosphoribosyl-AMP cyclohydrolase/phosphoribosyl-ATP diphosphatase HisIE [Firmicutes bacterium]|nr:bifunctional phosphoribosyl-AMP cyclohydrolase/phosphoribosyl-ATP diphosphatase HisIE [Bacillota bacterium]
MSDKLNGSTFQFQLKFGEDGLIPAIVQDAASGEVLMMAYMNREALDLTMETGETWFYSRSRKELWHKGETSGNVQKVKGVSFDCDRDTLLIAVEPAGAACHEGYQSCFYRQFDEDGEIKITGARVFDPEQVYGGNNYPEPETVPGAAKPEPSQDIIKDLYEVILDRQRKRPEGSYTTYLFEKGVDKICKKIGEEAAEVIIAAKNRSHEELVYESADLLYHLLVLLAEAGIDPEAVMQELSRRRSGSK